MEETINLNFTKVFKDFSNSKYIWNDENIIKFNDKIKLITIYIEHIKYNDIKFITKKFGFILNNIKKSINITNLDKIKNNLIKLTNYIFIKIVNDKSIESKSISMILNALSYFGYTKQDLVNNNFDFEILFSIINNMLLDSYNKQAISNTIFALHNFGFNKKDIEASILNCNLMFYLIGDIFENSNQFVIFDILCALAGFGYKKNDLYNYKINLDLIIKSINNIVSNSETLFPISMIFYILSDFGFNIKSLENNKEKLNSCILFYIINNYIFMRSNIKIISNTIDGIYKIGYTKKYFNKNNIKLNLLPYAINDKILTSNDLTIISSVLTNLLKIGYNKYDLDINNLDCVLNSDYKFKCSDLKYLISIIISVAGLGYTKTDLITNKADIKFMFEIINSYLSNENDVIQITNIFNSLSLFNYTEKELIEYGLNIELLFKAIDNILSYSNNSEIISVVFNSLVNIFYVKNMCNKNKIKVNSYINKLINKLSLFNENKINIDDKIKINLNLLYLTYIDNNIKINSELARKVTVNNVINGKQLYFENDLKCYLIEQILNDNNENTIKITDNEFLYEKIGDLSYTYKPNFIINNKYIIKLETKYNFIDRELTIKTNETEKEDFVLNMYCNKNKMIYNTISEKQFCMNKNKSRQFTKNKMSNQDLSDLLTLLKNINKKLDKQNILNYVD